MQRKKLETEKAKGEPCPCCGHLTISEKSAFEICQVCYWEDDGQSDADADQIKGGPNGNLSLTVARTNYRIYGASDQRYVSLVRIPYENEIGA